MNNAILSQLCKPYVFVDIERSSFTVTVHVYVLVTMSTATDNNKTNLLEGCDCFPCCRQISTAQARYSKPSVWRRGRSGQTVTMRSDWTATTDYYMVQGWQAFAVVGKSKELEQQQNHKDQDSQTSGPRKLHLHRWKYSRETKFDSGTSSAWR